MPVLGDRRATSRALFLKKFLRQGMSVASVTPSSRALATALCQNIDPTRPQTIVDVGAGTGAVTVIALEQMHPESRVIATEIDPQFADILRQRCPRAEVVVGDVRDLNRQLDELGVARFDVLICGLALPCVPLESTRGLFDCFAERGSDAWYSQLTLVPYLYRPMYDRLFEHVSFQLVTANFPPGGAYHCRGLRAGYAEHVPGKR